MSLAGYISFHQAAQPISAAVTKFGGQPVWFTGPEWPVSRRTGEPMLFIGQIALDREIFGPVAREMAYVFITEQNRLLGPYNFDPDAGENAVVIQPGVNSHLHTRPLLQGPSIYRWEKGRRKFLLFRERLRVPCEYSVTLDKKQDPDDLDWNDDDPYAKVPHDMDDCKIGGLPVFIQDEERPFADSTKLLLQLVWHKIPFHLDLGDAGSLYTFLSQDGRSGKLTWQCY
jgi:hypothetical protein